MQQNNTSLAKKMRVLISGALPPPFGGVGTYYQTLVNSSLSQQVNLSFVQTSSQKRELSETGKPTLLNLIYAVKDCWKFTWSVITKRPQIAHIGTAFGFSFIKNAYCIVISRIFGSRVLLHPHCSVSILYFDRTNWWKWFFQKVLKLTNGMIVLSREWLQLGSIVPDYVIYYLPNAINIDQYREVAERHKSSQKTALPIKVLYLGSIGIAKGSFDLLDAALIIRDKGLMMQIDMVGGPLAPKELAQLREKIISTKMEDWVRLHPLTVGPEKLDLLKNADIFAFPSHYEGMPMAVLEAMACALPIIATNVGGIPDLIQDGVTGILIEPEKPEQLARALVHLAEDDNLRYSLGKSSHQTACEQYAIEHHVSQLVHIYEIALSDGKTGLPNDDSGNNHPDRL
jgi:glycosyltransferase involved in cell wall biosynthesis